MAEERRGVARVLVVDDEDNISFLVASALRLEGFTTTTVANGRDALAAARDECFDLVVLDIMLPDLDGFEVLRHLRETGFGAPVLFLTARDATADRVHGLTVGGDDYVVKPFAIEELVARVHAVLRRAGQAETQRTVLRCADLELDDEAHVVRRAGRVVSLSPTEYKLLRYLLLNMGRVVSRGQILDHVWNYDFDGQSGVVDTFISYLRRKLDATEPRLIHTIRGVGYSIRLQPSQA
jgi:two-component system OmpR family response regulator